MRPTLFLTALLLLPCASRAQQQDRCRRPSLCSILVKHNEQDFADEIEQQFDEIPISPRFNDHNLSVRVVSVSYKKVSDEAVDGFVERNQIASRLVARWFDRDILTGACVMDTVRARGLYDATSFDAELARRSARGVALLEDAGEDLIGHTYLLVNEARYIDLNRRAAIWAKFGAAAIGALYVLGGAADQAGDMMDKVNAIISSYKGFSVRITTRLYRLVWDKAASDLMFGALWSDGTDPARAKAFEAARAKFRMEYVGEVTSKGGRTSFLGINEEQPQLMVRKACARAIDENVAELQHKFEAFRIKTPLLTAGADLTADIGMKEGVEPGQKFEVLEVRADRDGRRTYHRVGVVQAVAGKIWDNRFMAAEEKAAGADLGATTFARVSGDFHAGCVIREID